jgi:hypothetical protein
MNQSLYAHMNNKRKMKKKNKNFRITGKSAWTFEILVNITYT